MVDVHHATNAESRKKKAVLEFALNLAKDKAKRAKRAAARARIVAKFEEENIDAHVEEEAAWNEDAFQKLYEEFDAHMQAKVEEAAFQKLYEEADAQHWDHFCRDHLSSSSSSSSSSTISLPSRENRRALAEYCRHAFATIFNKY